MDLNKELKFLLKFKIKIRVGSGRGVRLGGLFSGPTASTKTSFANFDIVFKWVTVNSGSLFI